MAKKRSRQSREAESAAARQQGRRDNQLANKRQREGRHTRQTGGEASVDKRRRSAERTRGGGGLRHDVRRRDNQPEAPVEHPNPPPHPPPPAGMAAPLARSLAMAAAATSPASSASSASVKSARPPSSSSTPSYRRRRRPRRTLGAPFWRRRRPLQSSCGCSDRCGGWCDEKLTSVIRNYDHRWLCVVGVWNSLLASKGRRIFLIVIPQYVSTFLRE